VLLQSHRGHDAGALSAARMIAAAFRAPLIAATVSRLLVDLNRSPTHRAVFSPLTRAAPAAVRAAIVAAYYLPHRRRVERFVARAAARGHRVIHVGAHSFTPVRNGIRRRADVGLLYDPRRRAEANLCARWKAALTALDPRLTVRRNYPYAGKGDGLSAHLRAKYGNAVYVGIELEINQRFVRGAATRRKALLAVLIASLRATLAAGTADAMRGTSAPAVARRRTVS